MKDRITGVAFSADGQLIAASNDDSDKTRTAIWSAASGEVKVILDGFLQGFHRSASAVFLELPRRKYVASAEDGETIVKMPGNLHAVTGEFWSWTSTGKISRWIPGGKREQRKLEDVPAVRSFGLSSDGLHFATCHRDDRIRIWRWDEDACLGDAAIEHGILASVIHIALSAGALDVWVACGDVVRAWNRETKTWSIEIPNPGRNMGKVWLSPCGATLLLTDMMCDVVHVHDPVTKEMVRVIPDVPGARSVCFSGDGRRVALVRAREVTVFDTESWDRQLEAPGWRAAFDSSGRRLAVGDLDGRVTVFDLDGGGEVAARHDLVGALRGPASDR